MKIRLRLNDGDRQKAEEELNKAGIPTGDDGEFTLIRSDNDHIDPVKLLTVRDGDGHKSHLTYDEVIYIESYGHDVEVHTKTDTFYTSDRIYQLERTIDPSRFVRVSNSVIISKEHVRKIRPSFSMKFILTMSDGSLIDVTRSYYHAFKESFGI